MCTPRPPDNYRIQNEQPTHYWHHKVGKMLLMRPIWLSDGLLPMRMQADTDRILVKNTNGTWNVRSFAIIFQVSALSILSIQDNETSYYQGNGLFDNSLFLGLPRTKVMLRLSESPPAISRPGNVPHKSIHGVRHWLGLS
jgi:hypothetical protein